MKNQKRIKIFVLSGKRGGFGALRPFLKRIKLSLNTKLILALTDQHLSAKFGNTIEEVSSDFSDLELLPLGDYGSSQEDKSFAMSKLQELITKSLIKTKPDYVVVYGDRAESLVTAFVANLLSIKIIHFQGGDKSGSVDEHFRHAISKLSHLHFVSCQDSKKRLIQMGENEENIFEVGDSHIDEILDGKITNEQEMRDILKIPINSKIITLLQHSETTKVQNSGEQFKNTIEALEMFTNKYNSYKVIAIYPCSDPGYEEIVNLINTSPIIFSFYKNLDAPLFRSLVSNSMVLIGNSSAGIIESPYLGTPSINIGRRQENRLSTTMTLSVDHNADEIFHALERVHENDFYIKEYIYGNGNSDMKAYEAILKRHKEINFAKIFYDI